MVIRINREVDTMKVLLWIIAIVLLASCATSGQDYAVRDPIFEDEQNYIIFREDGCRDYLMKDPIFEGKDNFILFKGRCD